MGIANNKKQAETEDKPGETRSRYLFSLRLVERVHRLLLDVVKDEFEREGRTDVNAVQALLLFNIGENELAAGELTSRGYYLGSNVSYNLKKLVESGFIQQQRSQTDRRSTRVRLTDKGHAVCRVVDNLYERQLKSLSQVGGLVDGDLDTLNQSLIRLERFWTDQIRFRL